MTIDLTDDQLDRIQKALPPGNRLPAIDEHINLKGHRLTVEDGYALDLSAYLSGWIEPDLSDVARIISPR